MMQAIGWLMVALFVWLFHGAVAEVQARGRRAGLAGGRSPARLTSASIIMVNLPLGLIVVVIGGTGGIGRSDPPHPKERSEGPRLEGGAAACFETPASGGLLSMRPS